MFTISTYNNLIFKILWHACYVNAGLIGHFTQRNGRNRQQASAILNFKVNNRMPQDVENIKDFDMVLIACATI